MPFISPLIEPIKTPNKLKYVNGDLGFLKHPEWKHEVLGQIKGQNVVKIAKSNPTQDTVHFHVVDPKTNDIHMQLQGMLSPSAPHAFRIGWLEGRHSPVKAHELYDFLLRKGHVSQLETQEQSPGGARVWQKLANRRNINVYGLKDNGYNAEAGKQYEPVNVDLSNGNDYHDKNTEYNYIADADKLYPNHKKMADASYGEADHELRKKYVSLYASYHPHVLREAVQAIREMMTLNKLPFADTIKQKSLHDLKPDIAQTYPSSEQLGKGLSGAVFDRGKNDSVVKIYHFDPDRANGRGNYNNFVEHAKANQDDPHMPRIHAHKVLPDTHKFGYKIGIVRMERLNPIPQPGEPGHGKVNTILNHLKLLNILPDAAYAHLSAHPSLKKSVQRLMTNPKRPNYLDIHGNNIMQRHDGTLVITDPWAG